MANAWTAHLQTTFKSGRSKNKSYSFRQAMKDAKKTYKKTKGGGSKSKVEKKVRKVRKTEKRRR